MNNLQRSFSLLFTFSLIFLFTGCKDDPIITDPLNDDSLIFHLPFNEILVSSHFLGLYDMTRAGFLQFPELGDDRNNKAESALNFQPYGYIDVGDHGNLNLQGDFTFVLWIKPDTSEGKYIFEKLQGVTDEKPPYSLDFTEGVLKFKWSYEDGKCDQLLGNSEIKNLVWQHVTITREGDKFSLYLNGLEEDSFSTVSEIATSNFESLVFGTHSIGDNINEITYVGGMDEIRIYDRKLLQSEIEAVMLIE